MPLFNYVVLDDNGERVGGKIDAPSKEAAQQYLVENSYSILTIAPAKEPKNIEDILARFRDIKLDVLVIFSRQLATMIDSGMSPMAALSTLAEQESNPKFKAIILDAARQVDAGVSLSEAFATHPEMFDDLYIAMLRAGEESGALPSALKELSSQLEKRLRLVRAIKSAIMYPKIVLGFAFLIISGMLMTIVPKFAGIFVDTVNSTWDPSSGQPRPDDSLPTATQIVLDISHVMYPETESRDAGWWAQVGLRAVLLFVAFLIVRRLVRYMLRQPGPRHKWDAFKLKAPMRIGPLVSKIVVARFSRTFASLMRAGVPATDAMTIVADTSGNVLVAEAVLKARERMLAGATIWEPLDRSAVFPPMVTRMIQVGEETGKLEPMLDRVATFYEEEVDLAIKGITSIIEPMMMILVGAAIGTIVLVTYLPMFKIYDLIG